MLLTLKGRQLLAAFCRKLPVKTGDLNGQQMLHLYVPFSNCSTINLMKYTYRCFLFLLCSICIAASCKKNAAPPSTSQTNRVYEWNQFSMGADLSYVNAVENAGGRYTINGQATDVFVLLKQHGTNTVRVRLWHNPTWQNGLNGGFVFSNLNDVIKTIQRAKAAGMAVNLDLHYSDTWADPSHQTVPAAWRNLPLQTLKDSVYSYTQFVLQTLAAKNLTPEMIQIGNETNGGMCWPVGEVASNGWNAFATLLNAGVKAVRDFSSTASIKPKIILHHAQLQTARSWISSLQKSGVTDYDILGLSHYYKWSTVNNMQAISDTIAQLKTLTGKQIMIVETAFPFTNAGADNYQNIFYESSGNISGYPISIEGQLAYYKDLSNAVWKAGGSGIMIWEPAWITSSLNDSWGTGSSWENNAFFDYNGNLHKGIEFMKAIYPF